MKSAWPLFNPFRRGWRSVTQWLALLVAAGAGPGVAVGAPLGVTGRLEAVAQVSGDYVVDPHPDLAAIQVHVNALFERAADAGASGTVSRTFRYEVRLIDEAGVRVPLRRTGFPATDSVSFDPFTISLAPTRKATPEVTLAVFPAGAAPLDPYRAYRLEVALRRQEGLTWDDATTPQTTPPRRFYHFPTSGLADTSYNVIPEVLAIAWTRRHAVTSGSGERQWLEAEVTYRVHRCDGCGVSGVDPVATDVIPLRFDFGVSSDSGTTAATAEGGGLTSISAFRFQEDVPRRPWVSPVQTRRFQFRPEAQLHSVTETHRATVTIAHRADRFVDAFQAGNTVASAADRVLHFNGDLFFGEVRVRLLRYSNDPTLAPIARPGAWRFTLNGVGGKHSDRVVRDLTAEAPLTVDLLNNGEAHVVAGTATLTGPAENAERAHIGFQLPTLIPLDPQGARVPLVLRLPAGMGYERVVGRPLQTRLTNAAVRLDGRLLPTGVLPFSLPVGSRLSIENRPLWYRSSGIEWAADAGELRFVSASTEFVRLEALNQLRSAADVPEEARNKPANDGYYEFAQVSGRQVRIRSNATGRALTTVAMEFTDGKFVSHFPLGVVHHWASGHLELSDEQPVQATSRLTGVDRLRVSYEQGCLVEGCGERTGEVAAEVPRLRFTADGGLVAVGTATSDGATNATVRWGSSGTPVAFAHEAGPFGRAEYAMAGHWLAGGIVAAEQAAAALLNTGVRVVSETGSTAELEPIRPETAAYRDGTGAYPGLNVQRAGAAGVPRGTARLGGATAAEFPLSDRSKYYVRRAGVSGLHEAPAGQGPRELRMYDYPVQLGSFALSFASGANIDSATRGRIDFPFLPLDTSFPFEALMFTCVGAPDHARLAEGAQTRTFSHWAVEVESPTLSFVPQSEESHCDPFARRFLALPSQVAVGALDHRLIGTLYISAAGQLLNPASPEKPESASFHLSAPDGAALFGDRLGEHEYAFYPFQLGKAHFSAYDGSDQGWVILYGGMRLPFYGSTRVEVMTAGADPGAPGTAPTTYYVNGGWFDAEGWSGDPDRDPSHRGRPSTLACAECATWDGFQGSEAFPVQIRGEFAEVVHLGFDLKWFPEVREFRGIRPEESRLLVLSTERNLNRISARDLSVEFGVQYDGIPKVHLTQQRFELLTVPGSSPDFAGATAHDLATVLGAELGGSLNAEARTGFRSLRDIAANSLTPELTTTAGEIAQSLADRLGTELRAACGDPEAPCNTDAVQRILSAAFASVASPRLQGLVGTPGVPGPYLVRRQQLLDRAHDSLALLSGRGGVLEPSADGAVSRLEQVLVRLGEEAIGLNPDLGADAVGLFRGALKSALSLAQPAVRRTTNAVGQAAQRLEALRLRHGEGGDLYAELARIVAESNAHGGEFETLLNSVRDDLITHLASPRWFAENGTPDALQRYLTWAISDRLQRSDFARRMRQAGLVHLRLVQDDALMAVHSLEVLLEEILGEAFRKLLAKVDALAYSTLLQDFDKFLGFAEVRGYLDVSGDTPTLVRLDANMAFNKGPGFSLSGGGSITYRALDSTGERFSTCSATPAPGETPSASEVVIEFRDKSNITESREVPHADSDDSEAVDPMSEVRIPETKEVKRAHDLELFLKANLEAGSLVGLGGGFTWHRSDSIATLSDLRIAGSCMFGKYENYLAGAARMKIGGKGGAEGDGGIFLGRSCTLAPILQADPDAAIALGRGSDRPFTGFYVYGHAWIPLFSGSCLASLSGGAGVGAFADFESDRYGGKLNLGLRGELLCILSVTGELILFGQSDQGDFVFDGVGRIKAKVGYCPFCVEFGKDFGLTYRTASSDWSFRINP